MNVTLKHYKQIAKKLEKQIADLKELIYANPASKICQVRIKAQEVLKSDMSLEEQGKAIGKLADEEKNLWVLVKKSQSVNKDGKGISKLVKLEMELQDVCWEIGRLERKNNRDW